MQGALSWRLRRDCRGGRSQGSRHAVRCQPRSAPAPEPQEARPLEQRQALRPEAVAEAGGLVHPDPAATAGAAARTRPVQPRDRRQALRGSAARSRAERARRGGRARHASVLRLQATARVLDGDARRGADGGARALAGGPVAPAWGLSELRIPPDPVMDQRSCPIARWVAGPARPAARSPSALARRRRDRAVLSLRPSSFFVLFGGD